MSPFASLWMAKSCQSSDLVVEEKIREGVDHPMPVARPAHASVDAFRARPWYRLASSGACQGLHHTIGRANTKSPQVRCLRFPGGRQAEEDDAEDGEL
ncbi:hypothetical protein MY5147_000483 [Beauveria neobassiana]